MGKWPSCNTWTSSSIKWGDDSYPEGCLGQLKAPLAPCSAYSRCSITITPKDELPECIQALYTYNSLAPVLTLDLYICVLSSKTGGLEGPSQGLETRMTAGAKNGGGGTSGQGLEPAPKEPACRPTHSMSLSL